MEQMVSASLCGLPLAKASILIGVLHAILYGGWFFYEMSDAFLDWYILFSPPGLTSIVLLAVTYGMFSSEALLTSASSVCLIVGVKKALPGLIFTWLLQQATLIMSSFVTLFYFVAASFLKAPLLNCFYELCINGFQIYFFCIVYAHYQQLRKGNLPEGEN